MALLFSMLDYLGIERERTRLEWVSAAEGAEGAIEFANVEKAWIYTVDGKFVNFVKNPATVAAEAGVYVVKMQNGNVIRNAKGLVK